MAVHDAHICVRVHVLINRWLALYGEKDGRLINEHPI